MLNHIRLKSYLRYLLGERQQDNMLHQHQDNMLEDGEVVSFGQRAQQQQESTTTSF